MAVDEVVLARDDPVALQVDYAPLVVDAGSEEFGTAVNDELVLCGQDDVALHVADAAQFASFDALTGFGAAIHEAGREKEEKKELSEDEIDMINAKLAVIQYHIKEQPNITVTYFIPDDKKSGGRYVTVSGNVRKLDGLERVIMMEDGTRIPIEDVRMIEGDLFRAFEQY